MIIKIPIQLTQLHQEWNISQYTMSIVTSTSSREAYRKYSPKVHIIIAKIRSICIQKVQVKLNCPLYV